MVTLPFTTAVIRFPRRNPLCLLVLLVPLSLFLFITFSPYDLWNPLRIVTLRPQAPLDVSPPEQSSVDNNPQETTLAPPQPPPPPSNDTSSILLVSCFFPLSKSKHTMKDYESWLSKFLSKISTDIHFYTTPDMEDMVRQLRGDLPMVLNTSFASPFDIPPLQGREEAYTKMHAQDREKAYHSPELYAIWAAKPYLLAEALRMTQSSPDSKTYDYAFWTDAGAFRNTHAYRDWPGLDRVEEVWSQAKRESGQNADEILFFPIQNLPHVSMLLWNDQLGPIDNDFSEGSFFGGKAKTIFWWENFYYTYHNYYLDQGIFVGKDQTLINSLFLLHPERIVTVWHSDPAAPEAVYRPNLGPDSLTGPKFREATREILGDCGDPWYYYEFFLASWQEQEKMRAIWDSKWRVDFWKLSWWTRERKSCRVTRILAMEWLLWRPFGEMWRPPKATFEDKLRMGTQFTEIL